MGGTHHWCLQQHPSRHKIIQLWNTVLHTTCHKCQLALFRLPFQSIHQSHSNSPFVKHSDEPNASTLYSALLNAQSNNASASVGKIIDTCSGFNTRALQTSLNDAIFPKVSPRFSSFHVRFKTTYTVFMHFFLKVSHWFVVAGMQNLIIYSYVYSLALVPWEWNAMKNCKTQPLLYALFSVVWYQDLLHSCHTVLEYQVWL